MDEILRLRAVIENAKSEISKVPQLQNSLEVRERIGKDQAQKIVDLHDKNKFMEGQIKELREELRDIINSSIDRATVSFMLEKFFGNDFLGRINISIE